MKTLRFLPETLRSLLFLEIPVTVYCTPQKRLPQSTQSYDSDLRTEYAYIKKETP
jgi:hypothetical protein